MNRTNRILSRVPIGIIVLGLGMQLVPYGRNHTNPPVISEPKWDSFTTKALFDRTCADCHSNQTVWPWYSNVAPVSWLIQKHVDDGRKEFNVSEWGRRNNHGDEAARAVRNGSMPDTGYVPLHPEARLTDAEKEQLIKGLVATFGDAPQRQRGTAAQPKP